MTNDEIAKLISDGSFPSPCAAPALVETHISWVVLCEEYVYKIKKPVKYSFLDFSTPDKRKFFCEREVALNNRLTDGVYLDVLPIRKTTSSFAIGTGEGLAIDYAVRMRRLNSDLQMDVMLRAGKVSDKQIMKLAQRVAEFHRHAQVVYPGSIFDIGDKFNDLSGEKDFLSEHIGTHAGDIIADAIEKSGEFMARHRDLLKRRVAEGFTRDVHGDLHARNIFLLDPPVIFDCIEFNDDFRRDDLLNEVAFLCMDLDAFGYPELATLFMSSYQEHFAILRTAEEERLFNFYKSYRANVRAKVNSLRARSAADAEKRAAALNESSRYLDMMNKYIGESFN